MIIQIIFIIIGFLLLIKGADFLVKGGSNIAKRFHIPEIVIGLTIVSIGTSMPELFISVTSALNGYSDMAIGNVIGSNLSNLLLILGTCAIIKNLKFKKETRYFESPFTFLITVLVFALANNNLKGQANTINRLEGVVLLLVCGAFIVYSIIMAKKGEDFDDTADGISKDLAIVDIKTQSIKYLIKSIIYVILGIIFLKFGGDFVVDNASKIAVTLGMSEKMVSVTIIAIATSLPELITSIVATTKGKVDMAIGNIVGSNLSNLLLILGLSATIKPVFFQKETRIYEIPMCLFVTGLLMYFCNTGIGISRQESIILLILFCAFIGYTIYMGKRESKKEIVELQVIDKNNKIVKDIILIAIGIIGLKVGGDLTVNNAVNIANYFNLSEKLISLTILAIGTSLPELVTSVTAAIKGNSDIAIGNIIGSNIFNILLIIGISAFITPITYNITYNFDFTILLISSIILALFPFIPPKNEMSRMNGIIYLLIYAGYMAVLFIK